MVRMTPGEVKEGSRDSFSATHIDVLLAAIASLYCSDWKNVNTITLTIDCTAAASYSAASRGKPPRRRRSISQSESKDAKTQQHGEVRN